MQLFQSSFGKFDALGQGKEQLGLVGTNNDINQKQNWVTYWFEKFFVCLSIWSSRNKLEHPIYTNHGGLTKCNNSLFQKAK